MLNHISFLSVSPDLEFQASTLILNPSSVLSGAVQVMILCFYHLFSIEVIWGLHQVDSLYLLSPVLKIKGIRWKVLPKCGLVLSQPCLVHSGNEEEQTERSYISCCWSLPELSPTLTSSKICQGSYVLSSCFNSG